MGGRVSGPGPAGTNPDIGGVTVVVVVARSTSLAVQAVP